MCPLPAPHVHRLGAQVCIVLLMSQAIEHVLLAFPFEAHSEARHPRMSALMERWSEDQHV